MNNRTIRSGILAGVFWGGALAGVLDAVDALIAFGIHGSTPTQVYQFVASGLLGPAAFEGGMGTALFGLMIHFFIALAAAALFCGTAQMVRILTRRPVVSGLVYGALFYFVMAYLVLPFSRVPKNPFSWPLFLNGVIGHALFVGLPIALVARRCLDTADLRRSA